jgi:hypothetical protein
LCAISVDLTGHAAHGVNAGQAFTVGGFHAASDCVSI